MIPMGEPGGLPEMDFAAGQCPKNGWCIKPPGHRYSCAKYPPGQNPHKKRVNPDGSDGPAGPRDAGAASSRAGRTAAKPRQATKSPLPGLWALVYGEVGSQLEQRAPTPPGPAPGRVMQFTALDAGERLHRLLSRIRAYRVATALAGSKNGLTEDLMMVLAPPILAGVMASNPAVKERAWPMLATLLQSSAVAIAKAEREQVAVLETIGEHAARVDELLGSFGEMLFAPAPGREEDGGPDG